MVRDDLKVGTLLTTTKASRVAAGIVGAIAAIVLFFGWIAGFETPKRLSADFVAMAPSTSICFLFMSAAVMVGSVGYRARPRLARALVCLVIALAGGDLLITLMTDRSGIDALFIFDDEDHTRMAVATSASFLISGTALLGLRPTDNGSRTTVICATIGLMAAAIALAGYLFDAEALYGVFLFSAMALNTAVAFFFLFVAILLARPRGTWIALLLADAPGSRTARRLLPLFVGAAILLCYLTLRLVEAGIFDVNFRLSLLAISMSSFATVALLWGAAYANHADRERIDALESLQGANDDKALLLREVYHRVKNNLQQIAAMLRLEKRKLEDAAARQSYDAIIERVRTMGLVHQLLISSDRPSSVSMDDFLSNLVEGIASSHDLEERGITLSLRAEALPLKIDTAISLGLLVNEIVTNAIKHAFPEERRGRIDVSFGMVGSEVRVVIADDGVGTPTDVAGSGTGSLIIATMVSQIEGTLSRETGPGTRVTIASPANLNDRGTYQ